MGDTAQALVAAFIAELAVGADVPAAPAPDVAFLGDGLPQGTVG
jgi:hypothetical protein